MLYMLSWIPLLLDRPVRIYQLDENKYIRKFGKKVPNRELISILAQVCIAGRINIPLVAFINNDDKNNIIVIIQ